MDGDGVLFSFGPAGYKFMPRGDYVGTYFFYGNLVNRKGETENEPFGEILVILWMLAFPLTLFVYHIYLLCKNMSYIKRLIQLD